MSPAASWQDDPLPPVTGTFRTSWRTVLREASWIALGVSVGVYGLMLWNGDPINAAALWIFGLAVLGVPAFFFGRYRLLGVAFVEVAPEAVIAKPFGGPEIRIAHDELTEAWQQKKWRLTGGGRRITVREYGFTVDEWLDLSFALYAWQDAGPVETLPGVLARPAAEQGGGKPDIAVYESQHSPALWWGGPFFALLAVGSFLMALPSYRDGTWLEDPMLTVVGPLIGFGFVALFAFGLRRLVRRATFLPEALIIERYVGKRCLIPYEDILDAHNRQIATRDDRFVLGDRNAQSFHRLLDPRLNDGQLSGEMGLRFAFEMPYALYGIGVGTVLGSIASFLLPAMFGLPEGWTPVVFVTVLAGCMGATWLFVYAMLRREKNQVFDL